MSLFAKEGSWYCHWGLITGEWYLWSQLVTFLKRSQKHPHIQKVFIKSGSHKSEKATVYLMEVKITKIVFYYCMYIFLIGTSKRGQLHGAPGLHQTKWPPFIIRSIFVSWMSVWCLNWHNFQEMYPLDFKPNSDFVIRNQDVFVKQN